MRVRGKGIFINHGSPEKRKKMENEIKKGEQKKKRMENKGHLFRGSFNIVIKNYFQNRMQSSDGNVISKSLIVLLFIVHTFVLMPDVCNGNVVHVATFGNQGSSPDSSDTNYISLLTGHAVFWRQSELTDQTFRNLRSRDIDGHYVVVQKGRSADFEDLKL